MKKFFLSALIVAALVICVYKTNNETITTPVEASPAVTALTIKPPEFLEIKPGPAPTAVDFYTRNDDTPPKVGALVRFKKVVAYYKKLSGVEAKVRKRQAPGYYERLKISKEIDTKLPPEDIAVEEAHFRLWVASHALKDSYSELNRAQKTIAATDVIASSVPFHMDVGEYKDVLGEKYDLDKTIRNTFSDPDYISGFSLSDKRREELAKEVDLAIERL